MAGEPEYGIGRISPSTARRRSPIWVKMTDLGPVNDHDETTFVSLRQHPKDIGPIGRLLGWHWVARRERYAILHVPWWVPDTVRAEALKKVLADFQVSNQRPLSIRNTKREIRFDW